MNKPAEFIAFGRTSCRRVRALQAAAFRAVGLSPA